jgi:preprotein translocase subunit SecA
MFNPLNLITKFIKSSNQKELDRIGKIVKTINSLEDEFKKLDDLDFPKKLKNIKSKSNKEKPWMNFCRKHLHW